MPGLEPIYDLQENQRLVALDALAAFACSPDAAREHLYAEWQDSLEATKQAWLALHSFSERSGQTLDLAGMSKQFQEGLEMAGAQAQEAFAAGQALVESMVATAQNTGSLPESEQKALFKRVFAQLPQLLEQFSDAGLEQAAEDPDAWANKLYQQVFGETEQRKRDQRRQNLANEIRASIAERLRAAGIKPSTDFTKPDDQGENSRERAT
jgi:hypothetical protein